MSKYNGVCPTCHFGNPTHGGHCPNSGKPESEWTTHEEREAQRHGFSRDDTEAIARRLREYVRPPS